MPGHLRMLAAICRPVVHRLSSSSIPFYPPPAPYRVHYPIDSFPMPVNLSQEAHACPPPAGPSFTPASPSTVCTAVGRFTAGRPVRGKLARTTQRAIQQQSCGCIQPQPPPLYGGLPQRHGPANCLPAQQRPKLIPSDVDEHLVGQIWIRL